MMTFPWPTTLTAFLVSLVEFVEALTIVLAVGVVRGWRPALVGAFAAAVLLTVLVLAFGPHLISLNERGFQLAIGILLLLFGLRWLRKAVLRAAGVIALHDEAQEYAEQTEALRQDTTQTGFDTGAALVAFNGVFVEGVEVVFIVIGFSAASKQILPAALGAGAAAILVVLLGLTARHPLTRIPENTLKLAVGGLVSAFGTLWTGEGLGIIWPGGNWAAIFLSLGYFTVAAIGVRLARSLQREAQA